MSESPNDLKLTDAPEKQREALGGGTNANAASHVTEKGAFGAAPCSARGELQTSMSLSKNWNEAADIVAFLSTLQTFGEFPLSKFEKLLLDFTKINGSPDTAVWAGISLQATVSDSNL